MRHNSLPPMQRAPSQSTARARSPQRTLGRVAESSALTAVPLVADAALSFYHGDYGNQPTVRNALTIRSMRVLLASAFQCVILAGISSAQDFRVSVSVSPFTEIVLRTGARFTDGTVTATTAADLQRLFVRHGANEIYARMSTRQHMLSGGGNHGMDLGLARARMAAELRLPFNPELGLFATYGDIRCQPSPDFSDYAMGLPGPNTSLIPSFFRWP